MTRDRMRISPELLVHLRIALLGATGVAIEDLGTLTSSLDGEIERAEQPGLPGKRAAYCELMGAVWERYELQITVGLPGEELAEYILPGRAQQKLVEEVLRDYREAAQLALDHDTEMSEDARREAEQRVEVITVFLGDGNTNEAAALGA
jgi:hypothetical protein